MHTLTRLTATVACGTALALGSVGTASAAPLELETPITTSEAAPADSGQEIAVGTGSTSLSANPGSANALASGSGPGGTGSAATGSGLLAGLATAPGSANLGPKIGRLGPSIGLGIESIMRGLGFRPGNYVNCAEVQRAGLAPLLRGTPGFNESLDPDGDGIACD